MQYRPLMENPEILYRILSNGAVALEGERVPCLINRALPDGSKLVGGIGKEGQVFGTRIQDLGNGHRQEYPIMWGASLEVDLIENPPENATPAPPQEAVARYQEAMRERLNALRTKSGVPPRPSTPERHPVNEGLTVTPEAALAELVFLIDEVVEDNRALRERIAELEEELRTPEITVSGWEDSLVLEDNQ